MKKICSTVATLAMGTAIAAAQLSTPGGSGGGGGGSGVTSVNSRNGAVTIQASDIPNNAANTSGSAAFISSAGTGVSTALTFALNTPGGMATQDANSSINAPQFSIPTGTVVNSISLGDSLTAGLSNTAASPYAAIGNPNFSYTAYLASSGLFFNGSVFNASYSGYTVAQIANQYDPSPGIVTTTVTTTAGSTAATITGTTTGIVSAMMVVSPNTTNPSTNSIGTYAVTVSGTSVTLSLPATVTGSCTMYFGTGASYPGVFVNLNYPTPARNANNGNGPWNARMLQPAFLGTPAYTALWAGNTDLGVNMAAGYATCSGNVITFTTQTLTSACTWNGASATSPNVITVAAGTSIANIFPGMTVQTTTGMTSAIFVSSVNYALNTITLSSNPSGTGTSATLAFSVAATNNGGNAFYSGSNSDAQLPGTISSTSGATATMSSAPGFAGTKLIVLCPSQSTYRTTYQNLVTKMVGDNPGNGVVIFTHPRFYGPLDSVGVTAPITQSLCNGNSILWDTFILAQAATNVHVYDVASIPAFASGFSSTFNASDGVHYNPAGYQAVEVGYVGFLETTYHPATSTQQLPIVGKNTLTRNYLDSFVACVDIPNVFVPPQSFSSLTATTINLKSATAGSAVTINMNDFTGTALATISADNTFNTLSINPASGKIVELGNNGGGLTVTPANVVSLTSLTANTLIGLNGSRNVVSLPSNSSAVSSNLVFGYNSFTGSTASQTKTLPAPVSGGFVFFKNQSSVSVTVASNSGSQIWPTTGTATTSVSVAANASIICYSDGTYWNTTP